MVGVLYAVLLAFVVVLAWQDKERAEDVSLHEEQSAWGAFALVKCYKPSDQVNRTVRTQLISPRGLFWAYANGMKDEWQAMGSGESSEGDSAKRGVFEDNNARAGKIRSTTSLQPASPSGGFTYEEAIRLSDLLVTNRYERLHHYNDQAVDATVWLTLVIGGRITLAIPYTGVQ